MARKQRSMKRKSPRERGRDKVILCCFFIFCLLLLFEKRLFIKNIIFVFYLENKSRIRLNLRSVIDVCLLFSENADG